ncbi:hypothetical protein DKX38_018102 [Salix brachista]|uniref:Uncharacterized protein n=1 Tax=Salix brachista TaxID=2182728 RepID=A0A5N5KY46_9ROSI|nr:hypothetical protein DKX38_018102 [Salix brachista]
MPQAKNNLHRLRLAAAGGVRGAKHTLSFLSPLFFFSRFQLNELHRRNQWRIPGVASLLARKVSRTCDSIPTWLPVCAAEKLEGHALIKNTI